MKTDKTFLKPTKVFALAAALAGFSSVGAMAGMCGAKNPCASKNPCSAYHHSKGKCGKCGQHPCAMKGKCKSHKK